MFVLASGAVGSTLGLIAVFGGIGLLVNGVVIFIAAQVLAERQQNREERSRSDVL